ncbi:MAG: phosphoribosyltransferase [Solirubrobacteraceae bacterium]
MDGDRLRPEPQREGGLASIPGAPAGARPSRRFADRRDAGRRLAAMLLGLRFPAPVVVAMPRGGVPVAAEVAGALGARLDVAVVRKVGAPRNPEFALGAVAEGGAHVISSPVAIALGLSDAAVRALLERAEGDVAEKVRRYRGERPPLALAGRTAILVDDGLATGRSAHAALLALRRRGPARLILAVPVAARQSLGPLRQVADQIVCVEMPEDLWAVGLWYEDFTATSDQEVTALLAQATPGPEAWPL